jgi:hypothetical protein
MLNARVLEAESPAGGEGRVREGHGLEQLAHLAGPVAGEAAQGAVDRLALGGRRPRLERSGAGLDPERAKKIALRHRPVHGRAAPPGGFGQRPEIDMGGQVRLAGFAERVGESVVLDGLQGVSVPAAGGAVVDDQRGAARRDEAVGEAFHGGHARPRNLQHRPGRGRRGKPGVRLGGEAEDQALAVGPDQALAPAALRAHELPDRERVEELVGEGDRRAVRDVAEIGMPGQRDGGAREGRPLPGFEHGARFHEVQAQGVEEAGEGAPGSQGVGSKRSATGAELDEPHGVRAPHPLPDGRGPQPDQLPEHLADLGRGREIPRRAEGSRMA